MKVKPNRTPGGVLVELGMNEQEIPGLETGARSPVSAAFKLQRILVPIDFTPCSKKALRYALAFAKAFRAQLALIYVGQGYYWTPELGPVEMSAAEERARSDAAGKLASLAKEELGAGVPVDIRVRKGHAATEITDAALELETDLIIMSTHGYTGLKHAWFGSTTESVVRHAHCPVLVLREDEREFLI